MTLSLGWMEREGNMLQCFAPLEASNQCPPVKAPCAACTITEFSFSYGGHWVYSAVSPCSLYQSHAVTAVTAVKGGLIYKRQAI